MKPKPKKLQSLGPSAANLRRIHDAWPGLAPWQRRSIFARAFWWSLPALNFPVRFALLASLAAFALLLIMPVHPMAIPTSFGGGLALAILAAR